MHQKRLFANCMALAIALALLVFLRQSAHAQTFTVIHNFSGKADGGNPRAGLTTDRAGNLYGTTLDGGSYDQHFCYQGCGAVFKLKRAGSAWVSAPLYDFTAGNDGLGPTARVIIAPDGSLLGTTNDAVGCPTGSCGTVFSLRPSPTRARSALEPWKETPLYRFAGGADGAFPEGADLTFDSQGNVYGTTAYGGTSGSCGSGLHCGTVYQLSPSPSGWVKTTLHNFGAGTDGSMPYSGVVFDAFGNMYGTTSAGGANGKGTVFQLVRSGSDWTENVIHDFQGATDGFTPWGGLLIDSTGTIYGTTSQGGQGNGGTAFKLVPTANGAWAFTLLYSFVTSGPIPGSTGKLAIDGNGSLYGNLTYGGAHGPGAVFKLTPTGGQWIYSSLHDLTGLTDGGYPWGDVLLDATGNLYGTTGIGGTGYCGGQFCGVVWEITP